MRPVRIATLCLLMACHPRGAHGPVSRSCEPQPDEVVLFEDADHGGRCSALSIGDYVFPEQTGLDNDSASSIRVGDRVRALLCSDRAFGGECSYVDASSPQLASNDTLSSIRVERRPPTCSPHTGQVAVYADTGFAGACSVLGIGDFSHSRDLGIENDTISSLRVGPHTQMLVCRDDDWGGPCDRVTRDLADLGGTRTGNDAISSIRVLPGGSDCIVRGADARMAPHAPALEAACARAYPRIVDVLATNAIYEPPLVISFTSLASFTGEARGRDVFIDETRWNPADLAIVDHELTHIVTLYPDAPGWLSEGVADYVRATLDGWDDYHCRRGETYRTGYGCAAALLRYAERVKPGSVRALHAYLRTESFDDKIAERDVETLWRDCVEDGMCAPR